MAITGFGWQAVQVSVLGDLSGTMDGWGVAGEYAQEPNMSDRLCVIVFVIGVVSTLAGSGLYSYADGVGSAASFRSPGGVAVSSSGVVFVADSDNQRIRMITTSG